MAAPPSTTTASTGADPIAAVNALLRDGRFLDAKSYCEIELARDPRNLELYLRLADALHGLASDQPVDYVAQDQAILDKALAIDPSSLPVLEKLLTFQLEAFDYASRSRPKELTRLHDSAERILKINPADERAGAYAHIAVVAAWLQGATQSGQTVRASIEALTALQQKQPTNPEIPYFLAQAYLAQARRRATNNDPDGAAAMRVRAMAFFETAVADKGAGPMVFLRYYQVLRRAEEQVGGPAAVPGPAAGYAEKMRWALEQARQRVRAGDGAFADVYLQSAEFEFLRNTVEARVESERLLRELCAAKPDDQTARLALAKLIRTDRGKRAEAVELLRKPITDRGGTGLTRGRPRADLRIQTSLALATYLVEDYAGAPEAQRPSMRAEIDANSQRLESAAPQWSETFKLKAKIALLDSGPAGAKRAMPIIEQAKQAVNAASQGRSVDWELEFLQARCCAQTRQPDEARGRLLKIIEQFPSFVPARELLTELLVRDQSFDAAWDEVQELAKRTPDDAAVVNRLRVAIVTAMCDAAAPIPPERWGEVGKAIDAMPESDDAQRIRKARVCLYTKMPERAIPILEGMRARDPANPEVVAILCPTYQAQGQEDRAALVVEEALGKDPQNPALNLARAKLRNRPPSELFELEREAILATADPFQRNMKLFGLFNDAGKPDEALTCLEEAERLKPDDSKLLELRFQLAIDAKRWKQAAKYADRLGDADDLGGLYCRYRLAQAQGDLAAQADIAADMVKRYGQSARSFLCLAEVRRAQHNDADALAGYAQALQRQPENADALRGLIDCSYALEQPDAAKRYIDQGLKRHPSDPYFLEQQVAWELKYGDPTKAIEPRERAARAKAEDVAAQIALGEACFHAAQWLAAHNQSPAVYRPYVERAKALFREIKTKWPDDRLAYAHLAEVATAEGKPMEGQAILSELAERDAYRDKPDIHVLLGDYLLLHQKPGEAEAEYKLALEKSNNSVEMRQKLAAFYTMRSRTDEALALLEPAAADVRVQQQVAEILIATNRLPQAEASVRRRLAEQPNDAQFLAMLAYVQMNGGRTREAMESLSAALAADPKNQSALYYHGILRLRMRPADVDGALADLLSARDLNPHNVQVRLAIAEAHALRREPDKALAEMEAVLQFSPASKDVRMKLISLYSLQSPPRWVDVERLLVAARTMPGGAADPDWLRAEASMWMARHEPDKAIDRLRRAIAIAGTQAARVAPLLRDYLSDLLATERYQQVAAESDAFLKDKFLAENGWWCYQLRGAARAHLDRKAEAMDDFNAAVGIAMRSRDDEALAATLQSLTDSIGADEAMRLANERIAAGDVRLGVVVVGLLLRVGDGPRAIAALQTMLSKKDSLSRAERQIVLDVAGTAYMAIDASYYPKAAQAYLELIELRPDDTGPLMKLASLWLDVAKPPDPNRALVYSRKALDIMASKGSTDPAILDVHGWALTRAGREGEGIPYLRAAMERASPMEIHYHLGVALLQQDHRTEARGELESAHQMLEVRKAQRQPFDPRFEKDLLDAIRRAGQ